jgi:hypothetical protein
MEKFDMEKYPHVDAVMANVQGLFMVRKEINVPKYSQRRPCPF